MIFQKRSDLRWRNRKLMPMIRAKKVIIMCFEEYESSGKFTEAQLEQIKAGCEVGLDVHWYADPSLSAIKMEQIRIYLFGCALYHRPVTEENMKNILKKVRNFDDNEIFVVKNLEDLC